MFKNDEVKRLFEDESVLIGTQDVAPEYVVKKIFGKEAYDYVRRNDIEKCTNGYGVGNYTAIYFTYRAFQYAATYCNIREIEEIMKKEGVTNG